MVGWVLFIWIFFYNGNWDGWCLFISHNASPFFPEVVEGFGDVLFLFNVEQEGASRVPPITRAHNDFGTALPVGGLPVWSRSPSSSL